MIYRPHFIVCNLSVIPGLVDHPVMSSPLCSILLPTQSHSSSDEGPVVFVLPAMGFTVPSRLAIDASVFVPMLCGCKRNWVHLARAIAQPLQKL